MEPRFDLNEKDGNQFPIYIESGGRPFGFCPAKATWDNEAVSTFKLLSLTAETGQLYNDGGLSEQPFWFIELISEFIPRYNDFKFYSRAKMILGDGKKAK